MNKIVISLGSSAFINVGFSDHTQGNIASLVAVSLGAKVIEKHFTLHQKMDGPDHILSASPSQMRSLIMQIRDVEKCLVYKGDVVENEKEITPLIRRSIVASRDISVGEILSAKEITYKRPGTGLSPGMYNEVIGKLASKDIKENEQIKMENLK